MKGKRLIYKSVDTSPSKDCTNPKGRLLSGVILYPMPVSCRRRRTDEQIFFCTKSDQKCHNRDNTNDSPWGSVLSQKPRSLRYSRLQPYDAQALAAQHMPADPSAICPSILLNPLLSPNPKINIGGMLLQEGRKCLESNPHDVDNNVKALLLAAVVLERPHAVLLAVPVGAGGTVHPAAADLGEAGGLVLGRVAVGGAREGGRVLNDGAVDGVLEGRLVVRAGARLAD